MNILLQEGERRKERWRGGAQGGGEITCEVRDVSMKTLIFFLL